jgi:hypothetical protein
MRLVAAVPHALERQLFGGEIVDEAIDAALTHLAPARADVKGNRDTLARTLE